MDISFAPVDRAHWPDLEQLFLASAGEALGNPSRCWCMEWRLQSRDEWRAGAGDENRRKMRVRLEGGDVPGIIAYADGEVAGWCSISPRPGLIGLKAAGEYRNFEDGSVWVVLCFYVAEQFQGKGLMKALLRQSVEYAHEHGARVVEGYPFEREHAEDGAGGTLEVFRDAGFEEVRRIGEHQAVMRVYTEPR